MSTPRGYVAASTAARRRGLDSSTIRRWANKGWVTSVQHEGRLRVSLAEVMALPKPRIGARPHPFPKEIN